MTQLGLDHDIADRHAYDRAVARLREARITLPTFAELADPLRLGAAGRAAPPGVDPDAADAHNLFRVHWYNDAARTGIAAVPAHVVLPEAVTGVPSPIVVVLGDRFPMIRAHKVLAAYACLAPRIVTGRFDPTAQRALWPSTGNYCRGGVAISRIMGCRGVAILPAGMSEERFAWLEQWAADSGDIVRTPGTESNVKEIYDACAELSRDPANVVLNQFSEFGNHLAHYAVTAPALARVFESLQASAPTLRLAAFVSATGSAGTLGAGDWLKERFGARIVAVEALECPTMLYNGFGEHNIQGIGDKHIPLIHNVMNTDVAVAVSDRATDQLFVLFNHEAGRALLRGRGVPDDVLDALPHFGLSSICNVVAAIKTAKALGFTANDAVVTVATDGAAMYGSELPKAIRKHFGGAFDAARAADAYDRHLAGVTTEHVLPLGAVERTRIFNLGYFTWVEQQGVALADFEARRDQAFWRKLRALLPAWDAMIAEFNGRTRS
ncbi:MAG: pyridoxal-5'-phosphate-dependent protein subunit beta [Gemmatimonadetes bacterium GWC2_71_10]|nr:MAG: pyridoxal-5'-phosphate-dependent protein subunit beta [Gemmatimonadetes bacterium GWC2_71_10]